MRRANRAVDKKSINNHLAALRKLLNLAVEYGELDRAPRVRGFNLKPEFVSEDEYLDFDEAERLVGAAEPQWRPFLIVALKPGLRVGELLALKWQDLDLVAGQLIGRPDREYRTTDCPPTARPTSSDCETVNRA